jgi:hypothetical protein
MRVRYLLLITALLPVLSSGCASLPEPEYTKYDFPKKGVYVDVPPEEHTRGRKYEILGIVRTKINYGSMDPDKDEQTLCKNYYNKAAHDLLKRAKREAKGDAVIETRSVVFFMDGLSKEYKTPECSDDGSEGQILLTGKVIRYIRPSPTAVKEAKTSDPVLSTGSENPNIDLDDLM